MRARYSAFATGAVDFILASMSPKMRRQQDEAALRAWAVDSQWLGLDILDTRSGGLQDRAGSVEFMARYSNNGNAETHHEVAQFVRHGDRWMYDDGTEVSHKQPIVRAPRVGRNESCPCGSGKKYKKCCGG